MHRLKIFLYAFVLILSDAAALLSAFVLGYLIRSHILPVLGSSFKELVPLPLETQLRYGFLYVAIFSVLVIGYEKLYAKRLSLWDETKRLMTGVTLSFALLMVTIYVARSFTQFSRVVILLAWVLSLVLFPLFRLVARRILFSFSAFRKKVLILGAHELTEIAAREIERNWSLGYHVVGFLNDGPVPACGKTPEGFPILGEVADVEKLSRELGVRDLIISLPGIGQDRLLDVVERCEKTADNIRIIPDIGHLFSMGVEIENWGDVLALSMARNLVKPTNVAVKKAFEYVMTLLLLIVLLPVLGIIALAIKLDSRGPVLFVQDRLGWKDRTFKLLKFRSMYADGDARLERYLARNPQAQAEWKKFSKIRKNDPRVTRVGRIIRKLSLDELPQLINVLRGDMSLVGPRPYMPREREAIGLSYPIITRVRPGMTGLWQVRGRNTLPFKDRILLDEYYIRNWSLWMDIVILLKTLKVIITREGAF